MPNPFPGMNPYLELAAWWPSIHTRLITYLADALDKEMPSGYVANIEERCRIVQMERDIYPDVYIRHERPVALPASGSSAALATRTEAQAEIDADTALIVELLPIEPTETYIDIIDTRQNGRVVTTIEILSPTNKATGDGQDQYLAKQRDILNSRTHLLEIDLLRTGQPTVAVRRPFLPAVPHYDYLVCLHRAGAGRQFEVWPCSLRQRLPRLHVPLSGTDPDIMVDLQSLLNECFERGRFAQQINYAESPPPPLTQENAAWIDSLLREANLRK